MRRRNRFRGVAGALPARGRVGNALDGGGPATSRAKAAPGMAVDATALQRWQEGA